MKSVLITTITVLIFFIFLSLWGFYSAIKPIKLMSNKTPEDFDVFYQNVTFYTDDNIKIKGWFIPSEDPKAKTIILLHGYPADKGDILPSRLFLQQKYNLLFFDFRYFGISGGSYTTLGKNEVQDLLAAIKYLHTRGINEVGVWGLSMGGAVALLTAPRAPEIKAIVAESSYARLDWMADEYYNIPYINYGLALLTRLWGKLFLGIDIKKESILMEAEKLQIPILLIHSQHDNVIPFKHAQALKDALKNDPHLEIIFFQDIAHGQTMPGYDKIIMNFFDRYLK